MSQEKKNAIKSIVFYLIAILIIVLINVSGKFKSGPCTPNFDVLSVFVLAILNVILLIINGIKVFVLKKEMKLSTIIHLVILVIWIILLLIN